MIKGDKSWTSHSSSGVLCPTSERNSRVRGNGLAWRSIASRRCPNASRLLHMSPWSQGGRNRHCKWQNQWSLSIWSSFTSTRAVWYQPIEKKGMVLYRLCHMKNHEWVWRGPAEQCEKSIFKLTAAPCAMPQPNKLEPTHGHIVAIIKLFRFQMRVFLTLLTFLTAYMSVSLCLSLASACSTTALLFFSRLFARKTRRKFVQISSQKYREKRLSTSECWTFCRWIVACSLESSQKNNEKYRLPAATACLSIGVWNSIPRQLNWDIKRCSDRGSNISKIVASPHGLMILMHHTAAWSALAKSSIATPKCQCSNLQTRKVKAATSYMLHVFSSPKRNECCLVFAIGSFRFLTDEPTCLRASIHNVYIYI